MAILVVAALFANGCDERVRVLAGRVEVEDGKRVLCRIGLYRLDGYEPLTSNTVVTGERFEVLIGRHRPPNDGSYSVLFDCGSGARTVRYAPAHYELDREAYSSFGVVELGTIRVGPLRKAPSTPPTTTGPWHPLPEGWIFLQKTVENSWPGIYHDRLSGACVEVVSASERIVAPPIRVERSSPTVELLRGSVPFSSCGLR